MEPNAFEPNTTDQKSKRHACEVRNLVFDVCLMGMVVNSSVCMGNGRAGIPPCLGQFCFYDVAMSNRASTWWYAFSGTWVHSPHLPRAVAAFPSNGRVFLLRRCYVISCVTLAATGGLPITCAMIFGVCCDFRRFAPRNELKRP